VLRIVLATAAPQQQSVLEDDEDVATAARILDEVDAELGPVTAANEHLQTLLGILAAWLTIVTVAVAAVAMEMRRQWRDEANTKRAEWMGSVSSLDSDGNMDDEEEQESLGMPDFKEKEDTDRDECRQRTAASAQLHVK
jgi:hypothetical protein